MQLNQVARIIQGNNPTRIERKMGTDTILLEILTMQELNFATNLVDFAPEKKEMYVDYKSLDELAITKCGDVVIGLSSGKALVIDETRVGKLVLSNLAIIRIIDNGVVDPHFLSWYFNSNTLEIRKRLQGNSAVFIIPITELKKIEVGLPQLRKQQLIGKVYELNIRRERLQIVIENNKQKILANQLYKTYLREVQNADK